MDLKRVLMELGNALVTEHGMNPSNVRQLTAGQESSTETLTLLTMFLNSNEAAREELAKLGVNWSMVGQEAVKPEDEYRDMLFPHIWVGDKIPGAWRQMCWAFFMGRGMTPEKAKEMAYKLFPG